MQRMVLLHVNAPASPGSRRLSGLLPERTLLFAANARESGEPQAFRAGTATFRTFAGAYIAICCERPRVREIYAFPDLHCGKIGTLTLILHTEDFQMITWHEELIFDFSDPVSNEVFTENCIFFDIETTGFSPARTDLYLIGCATRRGSLLCIDQFFSENAADQKNVLSAFLDLLSGYDTILTFNGIGFDIPYLKACLPYGKRNMQSPFRSV